MESLRKFFDILSGEWLLRWQPNGGLVIFLRAALVSVLLFLFVLLLKSSLEAGFESDFSLPIACDLIADKIEWLGATFGGAYAAFYARFAGQWAYLANLYNQIMATKVNISPADRGLNKTLINWQIGFIADAHTLHLHKKDLFSSVCCSMLDEPGVFDEFLATMPSDAAAIIKEIGYDPCRTNIGDIS